MAAPRIGALIRVLLALVLASLVVAWLVSARLPRAVQAPGPGAQDGPPAPGEGAAPGPAARGALYIWRDARGVTHIASEPPPAHVQPEVVPFERAARGEQAAHGDRPAPDAAEQAGARHPLSVYSPEGFDALMEQVESTARRLEKRDRHVDELSKQL